jgi:DNA-directed RNA polymerase subunit H (RpoH/RPB5)
MNTIHKDLLSLKKDKNDIRNEVIKNITKMLINRKLLDNKNLDETIKKIKSTKNSNNEYNITLNNKEKIIIKFVSHKLTTINKSSGILDFLDTNFDKNFLLVVPDFSSKAEKELKIKYKKSELFKEEELLLDLMEHILVPTQYKIDADTDPFLKNWNTNKKNFPRITLNDPVSKYLNLKEGDIIRIVRPSQSSGSTSSYRIAVRGKMNKK